MTLAAPFFTWRGVRQSLSRSIRPILAAVLEGLGQAKRREYAMDDEVEAAFRRFDMRGRGGLMNDTVDVVIPVDAEAAKALENPARLRSDRSLAERSAERRARP